MAKVLALVRQQFAPLEIKPRLAATVPARLAAGTEFPFRNSHQMESLGKRCWAIPEGYIPAESVVPGDRALQSHEAVCLLNPGRTNARIEITIFFEDRDPAGPYRVDLEARRTKHLRFNDLKDPETIPRDVPYASLIRSTVPIIVQHTRLDSRNPNIALLSTIAFPMD